MNEELGTLRVSKNEFVRFFRKSANWKGVIDQRYERTEMGNSHPATYGDKSSQENASKGHHKHTEPDRQLKESITKSASFYAMKREPRTQQQNLCERT